MGRMKLSVNVVLWMGKRGVGAKQQVIPIPLNLLLISETGHADEGPLHMIVKLGPYYFHFIIKHHTLTYFVCVYYISVNIDHVICVFLFYNIFERR